MNRRSRVRLAGVLGALAFTIATPASALRIEGISPTQAESALVAPYVVNGALRMTLPSGGVLTISPWPAHLPQRLGRQYVEASRHLHPAGPVDRIEFRERSDGQPWLIIGNGQRPSHGVVGSWELAFADGAWLVRSNGNERALGVGNAAVRVEANGEYWCIFLLEAQEEQQRNTNVAREYEPHVSWVATRVRRQSDRGE